MGEIGKFLIILGLAIVVCGMAVTVIGKLPGAGKLPGDILIKKENFTFYFPLTTCILLSLVFSLVLYWFHRR